MSNKTFIVEDTLSGWLRRYSTLEQAASDMEFQMRLVNDHNNEMNDNLQSNLVLTELVF